MESSKHDLIPSFPQNPPPEEVQGAGKGWKGMILATTIFAGASAIILFIYGLGWFGFPQDAPVKGSILAAALGLQALMVLITFLLTLHAGSIRNKIVESLQWKRPEWGENVENPYQIEIDQAKIVHFFLLGVIPAAIIVILSISVLINWTPLAEKIFPSGSAAASASADPSQAVKIPLVPAEQMILAAILCMGVCILWLMFARAYDAVAEDEAEKESLPEAKSLAEAAWESCWWMGLAAAALFLKVIYPPSELVLACAVLLWILGVALEQITRLTLGWIQAKTRKNQFTTSVSVFLRYMVFVRGNPVNSFFYTLEKKWGVSFRSSWAIRFVARATVPALILVLLFSWGLSSLYVVQINELGLRRNFGKLQPKPLPPGLHWKLPYPFGTIATFPVREISIMPVGVEETKTKKVSYLWTHTEQEEYELALGNGNEAISIHAVVFYKIREDQEGFLQYALQFQNPEETLSGFAHHCLMELTRNSTLDQVLAMERDVFASEIHRRLKKIIDENRLGVEVIDVALISLHPPAKAADAYLDVISAEIEAKRVVVEATGSASADVFRAEREYNQIVTDAEVEKYERISRAHADEGSYLAAVNANRINPECFRMRYWMDGLQEILREKNLLLVDRQLDVFYDMKNGSPADNREVLMRME